MKKIIVMLFFFTLCVGLCACGDSAGGVAAIGGGSEVSVTLPTIPEQVTVPVMFATEETQAVTEPTGETYPWEAEFQEEDYKTYEIGLADQNGPTGSGIVWSKTSPREPARQLSMHNNGDIEDWYWGYPDSDFTSHEYFYGADGFYQEVHYMDNGYYDATGMAIGGTMLYLKEVNPDGSYLECEWGENGNSLHEVRAEANGYYSERFYYENGNIKRSIYNDPATGEYREEECFENGSTKKYLFDNTVTEIYTEQEHYENGSLKYVKNQTPEYTIEERYNEEGYYTYFYSKNANFEIELTADDTGKLVKAIENGIEIEDATALAQYASGYNFRE